MNVGVVGLQWNYDAKTTPVHMIKHYTRYERLYSKQPILKNINRESRSTDTA